MQITTANNERYTAFGNLTQISTTHIPSDVPDHLVIHLTTGRVVAFSPADVTAFLTALYNTRNEKIKEAARTGSEHPLFRLGTSE